MTVISQPIDNKGIKDEGEEGREEEEEEEEEEDVSGRRED